MRIGLCYDTKEDYGIHPSDMLYTDFATLSTVSDIAGALSRAGHSVKFINGINELKELIFHSMLPDVDLVFNISEGFGSRNREGLVPALLEIYNIPFSGSDAYAMSLTLNKHHTKIIANALNIPTPHSILISSLKDIPVHSVKYPAVVKPNYEGGSMGVLRVSNSNELIEACEKLFAQYSCQLLCEEYIEGIEVTVPVIGNGEASKALCAVVAKHADGRDIDIYSSELKYFGDIDLRVMGDDQANLRTKLLNYSKHMHDFLGLRDYSRFDYRIARDGTPYLLEINPMPSLDREDTFEIYAQSVGLEYHEIINMIVREAAIRNGINY